MAGVQRHSGRATPPLLGRPLPPTSRPADARGGVTALRRYVRSFTGFERDARIFLLTTLVYGVAFSLWWVDFNLYLVALDFDPAFIGVAATASAAAGVVFAFPASILSDRIGRRLVLALGTGGATLGILGLLLTTEPAAILLCAAVVGAANQAFFVVQSPSLMERSRPEHRNELFSLQFADLERDERRARRCSAARSRRSVRRHCRRGRRGRPVRLPGPARGHGRSPPPSRR